jgi:CheY-like chemotaxis protein
VRGSDVLGVMEFFSRDIRQPDAALLDTMMTAGAQIGLYVARKWAADELETFFRLSLDLLCVASLDGYFLRVNPAWTHVLGFDEDDHVAQPRRAIDRRLKILVAEDNPTNQTLVRLLLEQRRHRVTLVPDGRGAVAKSGTVSFDLILMDVQMPEMDGFEATAAIRQRERTTGKHIPIVAMTAHAMAGDRERCLERGMDAYVSKPLRAEELLATIDRLLAPEYGRSSIDGPALVADFGHNPTVLFEVIRVFLSDAPGQAAALRAAIHAADASAIAVAAHALKGSIGGSVLEGRRVRSGARAGTGSARRRPHRCRRTGRRSSGGTVAPVRRSRRAVDDALGSVT